MLFVTGMAKSKAQPQSLRRQAHHTSYLSRCKEENVKYERPQATAPKEAVSDASAVQTPPEFQNPTTTYLPHPLTTAPPLLHSILELPPGPAFAQTTSTWGRGMGSDADGLPGPGELEGEITPWDIARVVLYPLKMLWNFSLNAWHWLQRIYGNGRRYKDR
ncbi:hypothetical protein ACMFMF_011451 [Clarireedia jacksonii]